MLNSRALDDVAAALWRADSVDAGVPESVAAGRTRSAFDDESESTKDRWRRFARHAAPAVLTASMPEDVRELAAFLSPPSTHVQPETVTLAGGIAAKIATALASLSAKVEELTRVRDEIDAHRRNILLENERLLNMVIERDRIIAEKDKALERFAEIADMLGEKWLDHESHWQERFEITVGDLRRARAARDRRAS